MQEKIVAFNSTHFVVICDASKFADNLGQHWRRGVPVEIIPLAAEPIVRKMRDLGGASLASLVFIHTSSCLYLSSRHAFCLHLVHLVRVSCIACMGGSTVLGFS